MTYRGQSRDFIHLSLLEVEPTFTKLCKLWCGLLGGLFTKDMKVSIDLGQVWCIPLADSWRSIMHRSMALGVQPITLAVDVVDSICILDLTVAC